MNVYTDILFNVYLVLFCVIAYLTSVVYRSAKRGDYNTMLKAFVAVVCVAFIATILYVVLMNYFLQHLGISK